MSLAEMGSAAGALLNGYRASAPNLITLSGSNGTVQIDPATRTLLRSYGSSKKAMVDHYNLEDIVRVDIAFDDSRFSAVGDIVRVVAGLIPGGLIAFVANYNTFDPKGKDIIPNITEEMKTIMSAGGIVFMVLWCAYSHRNLIRMFRRLLRIFFFCCIRHGTVSFGLRGGPYDDATLSLTFLTCGDDTGLSDAVADVVFDEVRRPRDVTPLYPQHQGLPQLGDSNVLEQWCGRNSCVISLHEKSVSVVPQRSCFSINQSVVRHDLADIGLIRTGVRTSGDSTMMFAFLVIGFFAGGVFGLVENSNNKTGSIDLLSIVGFAFAGLCFLGMCCLCCRGFNLELSILSASNPLLPPCTFVGLAGEEVNHIVSAIRAQQRRLRSGPALRSSPPSEQHVGSIVQRQEQLQYTQQYPQHHQYPSVPLVGGSGSPTAGVAYCPPEKTAFAPRPQ